MPKKKNLTLFVVFMMVTATLACNFTAPDQPQAPAFPTEDQHLDIERVSLLEAKAAFDGSTAVFVDVRSSASYAEAHIPGSLSIPGTELESRLNELDPEQWIITYCT